MVLLQQEQGSWKSSGLQEGMQSLKGTLGHNAKNYMMQKICCEFIEDMERKKERKKEDIYIID